MASKPVVECLFEQNVILRGVGWQKNDFGSVFGSVLRKTAVLGLVSVLQY